MTLSIIINNDEWVQALEPSIYPANLAIAGKTVFKYWIEWAKSEGFNAVNVYSKHKSPQAKDIKSLEELYSIKLSCISIQNNEDVVAEHLYSGFGIFLENGDLLKLTSLDELINLETKLLNNPFDYSSQIGYGNNPKIQIGRNVFIHKSVKLTEPVIIGDNCVIESNIDIQNSVINSGVHLKQGSVVKNSRISKSQNLNIDVYFDFKALFTAKIYDLNEGKVYNNENISRCDEVRV